MEITLNDINRAIDILKDKVFVDEEVNYAIDIAYEVLLYMSYEISESIII